MKTQEVCTTKTSLSLGKGMHVCVSVCVLLWAEAGRNLVFAWRQKVAYDWERREKKKQQDEAQGGKLRHTDTVAIHLSLS